MSKTRIAVIALAAFLSACSGATVEDVTPTTVAPLTKVSTPETTSASAGASTSNTEPKQSSIPLARDGAGQEISAIPESTEFSKTDQGYLDALREGGIDIEGVENQMIGAANAACHQEENALAPVTVDAVAGQLIEQGRTSMEFDKIAALIEKSAKEAYC